MPMRALISALLLIVLSNASAAQLDLDADGHVDLNDFVTFALAFKTSDPACDLNRDGSVDQADVDLFIQAFQNASHRTRAAKFARLGKANLYLRQASTLTSQPALSLGDTLTVELFIEARNERLTGAAVFLEFDDQYLELIPARALPFGDPRPFHQGPYLGGTVFGNNTLGDQIGDSNVNRLQYFQLYYNEDIPPSFDGTRRAATGDGALATFKLRATWPIEATSLRVVRVSPTGSESGYFNRDNPGVIYSFSTIQNMDIRVLNPTKTQIFVTVPNMGKLKLEMARSIAGRHAHDWRHTITDTRGRAALSLSKVKSGLYMIRAVDPNTDQVIGLWHSIPINPGASIQLTLPIGAPARVVP